MRLGLRRWVLALLLILSGAITVAADEPGLSLFAGDERLAFTPGDILSFKGDRYGADHQLTVAFSGNATTRLAAFTQRHVGREIAVAVCGREVLRANLIEPITSGSLAIGAMSEDEARSVALVLSGQAPCS